jgi:hypothetical protein
MSIFKRLFEIKFDFDRNIWWYKLRNMETWSSFITLLEFQRSSKHGTIEFPKSGGKTECYLFRQFLRLGIKSSSKSLKKHCASSFSNRSDQKHPNCSSAPHKIKIKKVISFLFLHFRSLTFLFSRFYWSSNIYYLKTGWNFYLRKNLLSFALNKVSCEKT